MRRFRWLVAAAFCLAASSVAAEDFPKFPKIKPPQPLPEALCDKSQANSGDWLIGGWTAPGTRIAFTRQGEGIGWVMDRKAASAEFGIEAGKSVTGTVTAVTGCTVTLGSGQGFVFDGVRTEEGKIYGFAPAKDGSNVRMLLQPER